LPEAYTYDAEHVNNDGTYGAFIEPKQPEDEPMEGVKKEADEKAAGEGLEEEEEEKPKLPPLVAAPYRPSEIRPNPTFLLRYVYELQRRTTKMQQMENKRIADARAAAAAARAPTVAKLAVAPSFQLGQAIL